MDGSIVQYRTSQREDGVGESVLYRASSLGAPCEKALIAVRMGYTEVATTHESTLERFAAGKELEETVVSLMKDEGWVVWNQQHEVVLMLTGSVGVIGHVDGYTAIQPVLAGSDKYVLEVKTQSKGEWAGFENNGWESGFFPRYAWQVSAYMIATGLPLCLVRGLRSEDNRRIEKIAVSFYDQPFHTLQEIRERVLRVEVAARRGELPDDCTGKMFPCPVPYLDTEPSRELNDDPVVEAMALTFKQAEIDRKIANKRYDDSKSALQSVLGVGKKVSTSSGIKISTWEQGAGIPRLSRQAEDALSFILWWFWGINLPAMKELSRSTRVKVTLPHDGSDKGEG